MDIQLDEMGRLSDIFNLLIRGRHICLEDGEIYGDLEAHREALEALFKTLGFELRRHDYGFYHFVDEGMPMSILKATHFVAVLVQDLTDQGIPMDDTLLKRPFKVEELPHFKHGPYRETMEAVGCLEGDLRGVLRALDRYGFAEVKEETFTLRRPVFRLFDILLEAGRGQDHSIQSREDEPHPAQQIPSESAAEGKGETFASRRSSTFLTDDEAETF